MSGMGMAFSSSLLGLAGALVMGFLDLQANGAQNRFYNGLDEHLAALTRYASGVGSTDDSVTSNAAYTNALLEQMVESMADIRRQLQIGDAKAQERAQNDTDLLRYISRIDRSIGQIDKNSEARQEILLREVRDSFRLLIRTISGTDGK